MILKFAILIILVVIDDSAPYRILGVLPYKGTSHSLVMLPLFDELAKRGHDVHVMSYFPKKQQMANYTSLPFPLDPNIKLRGFIRIDEISERNPVLANVDIIKAIDDDMENSMMSPHIQKVIKEKWDAVIVEYFNTDMFASIAHVTGSPLILFHTSDLLPYQRIPLGEPLDPSYIAHPYTNHPVPMPFVDRLINTLEVYYHFVCYHFDMGTRGQRLAEKYLGPLPKMTDLIKNASLFLVNSHPSFHRAIPATPFIVQVGGIHLKPKHPLPSDILRILDESKKGVIYFSLGSVLSGDSMPENQLKRFVSAFEMLHVDVLWKFEGTIKNKPSNIHSMPWLPQRDILGHPKVLLFISHCGLLSIEEALTEGVPIICIPIFADQFFNARRVQELGIGEAIDFWRVSIDSIKKTIDQVLNDPSYKKNAIRVKNAFNDRPASAMDTAVYWVEYVIRHEGAPHLKSAARYLSLYQLHNLDVWGVILGVILTVAYVILIIVRIAFARLRRNKSEISRLKKTKKNK